MREIFKDIKGYEGIYQISNLGRVKSFTKNSEKFLKPNINRTGYATVRLYKDKIKYFTSIHRLIALAFIPNPENKRTVNHINGIKDDNRIENLEWNTYQENNIHALKNGLRKQNKIILQYDLDNNFIKEYKSIEDAGDITHTHKGSISEVCHSKRKTAGGFIWKLK